MFMLLSLDSFTDVANCQTHAGIPTGLMDLIKDIILHHLVALMYLFLICFLFPSIMQQLITLVDISFIL
jgi:hypothetical protein